MAKAHMLVFSPVTESSFSQQRLPGSKVGQIELFLRQLELLQKRCRWTSHASSPGCSLFPVWSSPGAVLTSLRTRWPRTSTPAALVMRSPFTRWAILKCVTKVVWKAVFYFSVSQVLAHTELPSETTFGCEIYIPGTEYFVRYHCALSKRKHGIFSFLPFLIALICREEARYDQHEQHRTRRSPKIFQPIGVKHWWSFSQLEWNLKCDFEQNLINCFVYAKMYLQRASDKISRAQIVWIYNGWTPGPQKNRQQGTLLRLANHHPSPVHRKSLKLRGACGTKLSHDRRNKNDILGQKQHAIGVKSRIT